MSKAQSFWNQWTGQKDWGTDKLISLNGHLKYFILKSSLKSSSIKTFVLSTIRTCTKSNEKWHVLFNETNINVTISGRTLSIGFFFKSMRPPDVNFDGSRSSLIILLIYFLRLTDSTRARQVHAEPYWLNDSRPVQVHEINSSSEMLARIMVCMIYGSAPEI